jgi:hypothetical protein
MSENNLQVVHLHQSGPIPGLVGWFSGGQTVTINTDTMEVVDQAPLAQRAYDATPLVEPAQEEEAPAQPELVQEAPTPEPAPVEPTPEPTTEQAVDVTPAQEVGEV